MNAFLYFLLVLLNVYSWNLSYSSSEIRCLDSLLNSDSHRYALLSLMHCSLSCIS